MLERVAAAALKVCSQVFIVGRTQEPAGWPKQSAVNFLADDFPAFSGPLSGIITALRITQAPTLVLACDMPLITAELLKDLVSAHSASPGAWATLACRPGSQFIEPALGIYSPALLPDLMARHESADRSLQSFAHRPRVRLWAIPAEFAGQLLNVNDPSTLREAEAILQQKGR